MLYAVFDSSGGDHSVLYGLPWVPCTFRFVQSYSLRGTVWVEESSFVQGSVEFCKYGLRARSYLTK